MNKKIKGRFAPLTEELGDDQRFILECDDFEKLMYLLIIYTTHMTRHQAPTDPRYYQRRYGLKARSGRIARTIATLIERFPKLKCSESGNIKTLSLINSTTYKNQILDKPLTESDQESESDTEKESEVKGMTLLKMSNSDFDAEKLEVKNGSHSPLTIKEKQQLHDKLEKLFVNRGWNTRLIYSSMIVTAGKVAAAKDVKNLFAYYEASLVKHLNENAELLNTQSKEKRK